MSPAAPGSAGAGADAATNGERIADLAAARSAAGAGLFEREAERIATCCHRMAERFARGARLVAIGGTPSARSDARHVSVEFVHPVIVGKRALPAIAVTAEGGDVGARVKDLLEPGDIVIGFEASREPGGAEVLGALSAAADRDCMNIGFGHNESAVEGPSWVFGIPVEDAFIRQELIETLYHLLWELVHVFFDHRGLLEGRNSRATHDAGASSFLYPFLGETETDLDSVLEDVRRSVVLKSQETGELRESTLNDNAEVLEAAAAALRERLGTGATLLALGNGGSATDAMDVVADFRDDGEGRWMPRRALDLTEDAPILTAVANDVGVEEIFQRQVIAYGRKGDVLIAFSTSGGSENLIEALAQARRQEIATIAMVGYDGGRIAAEGLADHVVVSRSQNIPRIQEAQASAYHVLRELVG